MTPYLGIFLRDQLDQINTLPRSEVDDTSSPDIINSGLTEAKNPQVAFGQSYTKYVGEDLNYGKTNHIYVRGKNYASRQVVGSATLYWAYKTKLSDPSSWQQLVTDSGANSSPLAADEDGVAVTGTPFVWAPITPSSGNPYILIAVVSDPNNPDPVADYMQSIHPQPFDQWQSEQGGVAALQMAVPTPPETKPTYSFTGLMVLDNGAEQKLNFTLMINDGVVGDHISCSFDQNDASGNPMGIGSTQITQSDMEVGFQATVDTGFTAHATFEYSAADTTAPPHPTLTLQVGKIVSSGGGGDDPFGPGGGNDKLVVVAQYVMTTQTPS
ncbi:hypothetical protein [Hoeflea ulvae]|uniref:Uncharacterized protein n=1 Tax=Hoeflea ulvae TaxID=2983764 RepID=A0ABT3YG99_9HYPH|nr:hypothetical protein [Hoeflea ulvae]MCY0094903.1 hypothetical protein [Hoeflea ulvae]